MPDRRVISNTSPLFYLHQIERLGLLRDLYQNLYVPLAVEAELRKGAALGCSTPDLATLSWVHVQSHPSTVLVPTVADLGPGESEVITLGMANPGCLLLLDDALGRSVAAKRGLTYTGTLGVLIRARKEGLLPDLGAAIEDLRQTTMYLSPGLISAVLAEANES
ncbi:MAG TPA: DUF3368 domain-containing protein [Thermoanaerobaculia bacterium]|nr:DUF3368 domain-containing protein [Thermoanaerobaculia bacterium]